MKKNKYRPKYIMYKFDKLLLNIIIIFNMSALKCALFELFPTHGFRVMNGGIATFSENTIHSMSNIAKATVFWTLKLCIYRYNVPNM